MVRELLRELVRVYLCKVSRLGVRVCASHLMPSLSNALCLSSSSFRSDLSNTLHGIRQRFGPQKEDASFKLISGSIFLRFLCPAILSPSLFQLCQGRSLTHTLQPDILLSNPQPFCVFLFHFVSFCVQSIQTRRHRGS